MRGKSLRARIISNVALLAALSILSSGEVARAADFTNVTGTLWTPGVSGTPDVWGDYNNDGYPDMFAPDALYTNNTTGGFTKTTPWALDPNWSYLTLGDYDNDNDLDVFSLTEGSSVSLYTNKGTMGGVHQGWDNHSTTNASGNPSFITSTPRANLVLPPITKGSATWADLNDDGYLDIYLTGWCNPWEGAPDDDIIYMSNANPTNMQFDMTWKASDASANAHGKGVTTLDFNRDGKLDIYTSNYWLTPNYLWRNDGFNGSTGLTAVGGVAANGGHTQGSAVGDFDNDGDFDIFVANFAHPVNPTATFLENQGSPGDYNFTDTSLRGVVQIEPLHAGAVGDYDNDGHLDLYVTTIGGYAESGQTKLYHNDGDGTFTEVTSGPGVALRHLGVGPTASWADYDGDGFLDIVADSKLWKNPGTAEAGWANNDFVKVKLEGGDYGVDGSAIGAQVIINVPGLGKISRQVEAQTGNLGMANDQTLHFGLGNYSGSTVDLEIFWPNGTFQSVTGVAINQTLPYTVQIQAPPTVYADNFDSYADGTNLGDTPNWAPLNTGEGNRDLKITKTAGDGEVKWNNWGYPADYAADGAYCVAASQAGEPYARVQVDYLMTTSSDPGFNWGRIGLNGDPATAGKYGGDNSYNLTIMDSDGGFYMMTGDSNRLYTDPLSPVAGQWYTLILEADYSVADQVTLTGTIKLKDGDIIGQHTVIDTTLLYSGGYAFIQLNDFPWQIDQGLRLDNFYLEYTPEPATLGLLLLGALTLLRRRRK